jgi:hypothetical protein
MADYRPFPPARVQSSDRQHIYLHALEPRTL